MAIIKNPLTLFRLNQEFPVTFTAPGLKFTVVGADAVHKLDYMLFWNGILSLVPVYPSSSHLARSAIPRFEPSTSAEHAGRRVLCLRIVRLVTTISSVLFRSMSITRREDTHCTVAHRRTGRWAAADATPSYYTRRMGVRY
ncbi:hypothetical protein K438DRAFT_1994080 [Mycena galopus ATCC 62051]|nr:hypothetical protein K438DRAFT_1994080 [Mycena galopus ATCC 62051]